MTATAALCLLLSIHPPAAASSAGPALRLDEGAIARRQLVAIGRDLVVAGSAMADVAVMDGDAEISGTVERDVIVLEGDVRLAATARVGGDVFVVGGTIEAAPGARIGGRSVAYETAAKAWLTLLEGPTVGLDAGSPVVLGAKLALLATWSALVLLLFATAGRQVLSTAESVRDEPFTSFVTGLTGLVALVLTALFVSAFLGSLLGVPLLVLVILLALILKLWGMVAVFHALGDWLWRRLFKRRPRPINAATLGLVVLGAVKLLPWFGVLAWTAATLIGVGAALATKLGRREPWFELA